MSAAPPKLSVLLLLAGNGGGVAPRPPAPPPRGGLTPAYAVSPRPPAGAGGAAGGVALPATIRNFPSRENFRICESAGPPPPIQMVPCGSIAMPWFCAGQGTPSAGPPQWPTRLP